MENLGLEHQLALSALSAMLQSKPSIKCKICGEPCDDDQTGQANPYCPKHEEEHRQKQNFMTEGGGNDPSTAEEETMKNEGR